MPSGPLAVVGLTGKVQVACKRFVNVSPSKQPARLFKTATEAHARLATQAKP